MKKSIKLAIALLTAATALPLEAGSYCPDATCRMRRIDPPPPPFMEQDVDGFFSDLFAGFDGCSCSPYIVFGGSGNYSTSSYPQFALYDLGPTVLEDVFDFGGTAGYPINSETFKRYFWGAYGGFHVPVSGGWDLGIELGYKKLMNTESQVNIYAPVVLPSSPLFTPFRDTRTYVWDLLFTVKYQTYSGFNLFIKAGGAKVTTDIREGNFIPPSDPSLSGLSAFGTFYYSLTNIYPEIEVGAGYRFLDHFEVHLSYAKIIAPYENDLVSTSTNIFVRPRKCPSIDILTVSLEVLLF